MLLVGVHARVSSRPGVRASQGWHTRLEVRLHAVVRKVPAAHARSHGSTTASELGLQGLAV